MAMGTSKLALRPIHKGAQKNNKNNKNKEKTVTKKEKEELLVGCDPIKAGGSSILKIRDDLVEHGSNGGSNTPLRHTKIKFADELSPVHEELKKPLSRVSLISNASTRSVNTASSCGTAVDSELSFDFAETQQDEHDDVYNHYVAS